MKRVCVFCGSLPGEHPAYAEAAIQVGAQLARRGVGLVFGGGRIGLMGAMADAALAAGGEVVGVIPRALVDRELAHRGVTELRIVNSMHERKALMAELSDAFIALPGGFGTLDELCEVLTWAQLGFHGKPCGLLNTRGFYGPFLDHLARACSEGFLPGAHRALLLVEAEPGALLDRLESSHPPGLRRWLKAGET